VKVIKTRGNYCDIGRIKMENLKMLKWSDLSDAEPPEIPFGSSVEITISIEENDFLSGKDGVVWATYDLRQAEIIQSALLAQHISSEVNRINLQNKSIQILRITNESDINDAIDFIWKTDSGLRLKPDWNYPDGDVNKSFELWLNDH
jgi:hypothetical protein